jgi:hypothetical protein
MRNQLPKFIGGTHDGDELPKAYKVSGRWPPIMYKVTRITLAEYHSLKVDENIMRRAPDDVYDFDGTNYVFRERIDY